MTSVTSDPVTLHSLLGTHPGTSALKGGQLSSSLVTFDYFEVKVANTQFKAMVRDLRYDFGELAIVTFLQARAYGKPYVLLPATIVGRNQHHTIFYNADRRPLTAHDLNGRRVGVRAYTQTTGAWVRGLLADDYGVDLDSVTWVTFEDPHLAEYRDPATVERAPEGKALRQMLLDGEIDLSPDPEAAGRGWARGHGGVPVNHLAVMRESIVQSRPDVVREVYRLLRESRAAAALPTGADDPLRFGIEAIRGSLDEIAAHAFRQHLVPRRFFVDELFADAARVLGSLAG
jgi:4,5-dihydroxyphthalate decarboxylase